MIGTDIDRAIALLKAEQLVALPTETVYGLAGNALSESAVTELFTVKNRPRFDPLIIHLSDWQSAERWVKDIPEKAQILAEHFLPGPLTLLMPKKEVIPDLVTAGSPLVAVRVPDHPLIQRILHQLDFPLAAPSANPFGYISPTTAQHVFDQLGGQVPYILDGGPCVVGLESTIVGFEQDKTIVFRKGGIPVESIEGVIGSVEVRAHSSSKPAAPGMLKSHYAPRTPIITGDLEELLAFHAAKKAGLISFRKTYPQIPAAHQLVLSTSGDFREAARNLFNGMRRLDQLDLDVILAEFLPEKDLGRAINDRLRRASA